MTIVKSDETVSNNDDLIDFFINNGVDLVITLNEKQNFLIDNTKSKRYSSYLDNDGIDLKYSTNLGKSYIIKNKLNFKINASSFNFFQLKIFLYLMRYFEFKGRSFVQ